MSLKKYENVLKKLIRFHKDNQADILQLKAQQLKLRTCV